MNTIDDKICYYQAFRPAEVYRVEGVGDCTKCSRDEKNELCKNYFPISKPIEVNIYDR